MTTEIRFVDSYACPRCLTELEAPPGYESVWLVCPQCGRAALPPEPRAPVSRPRPIEEGIFVIGPADEPAAPLLAPGRSARRPISAWRIFLLFGFVVSFCGLAEALLAQHTVRAAVFGLATLVVVGLMTYPTKSGHR